VSQPNADAMRSLVKQGKAMAAPGQSRPGRFPIRDRADLEKAISAVGRAGGPSGTEADRVKVRRFILKRARALGLMSLIPAAWSVDGSLKS
jgi:hypothetical protein